MTVVGFSFSKLQAVRGSAVGRIQVNNNIGITDVKLSRIGGDQKKATVRIFFRFESRYEPKAAQIILEGDTLVIMDKEIAEKFVDGWKKDKVLVPEAVSAMNQALDRCNIEAMILARDLNLPSPVPLPKVNLGAGKVKEKSPVKARKPTKKTSKK